MSDAAEAIDALYGVILSRQQTREEGSYTCYLFEQGLDKILKKCGEECAEVIIAAKNGDSAALTGEVCDLLYHVLVLMAQAGLPLADVGQELARRALKIGNLKEMRGRPGEM